MKIGLSYGDVAMVPKFNNVISRSIPVFKTQLTKKTDIAIPILASNMDTIIGPELAEVIAKFGSTPIFHRFYKEEKIAELIDLVRKYENNCYVSWGASDLGELFSFLATNELRPRGVCVDLAHGHSIMVEETIKRIKDQYDDNMEVIAGNICTPDAV
ncbi:MAG: IMP dehydrogenase, partial [Nitrososphaera sp.]|nr:IMP dehydrogenase [Nitrososphaera sp.]